MSAMGSSNGRNNPGQDQFGRGGHRLADNSRGRPYGKGRRSGDNAGGGRTSSDQSFSGRKNVGDSHGAPPGKILRSGDDSGKSRSPLHRESESQFDISGGHFFLDKHRFVMYCALCNFNTLETKDMDAHMESDQHKSSLLLVDKHFPKDKMLSRFLNERMRMLNKKIEIRKRSWEKEHGGSDKTNLTLTGADIPDCMQQMDVVRCPACRTFIPALEWEVQAHLQSVRHASIFQYVQQKNFDKIRDIGVKVLRKQGGNMQYEVFKKGGDPFAAEILALERREEQKETLAKGEEQKETLAKGEEQKETLAKGEEEKETLTKGEEEKETLAKAEEEKKTLAKAEEEKETLVKGEEEKETLAKGEEEKETLVKGEEEKETLVKGEEEKETLAKSEEEKETSVKGEEEKTLVKGVSKAKRLPKVKKMLNKNVQNNGQEDEKEKSLEEDRTKDEQEQQGTKIGSVKAKDDKIEEKEEEENDRDVLEQRDFEVSGDSDKGEGEEEGTDEEERHLLNFEEEEDGGIV